MFSQDDVRSVYKKIKNHILKTPCLYSPYLSEMLDAQVYLKLENIQQTGSFKERGALNFLLAHENEKISHVVCASAGNHAQAVALNARRLNIKATIFMPRWTPNTKILSTEKLNAQVKLVGDSYDDAYRAALEYSKKNNVKYLHAYDDLNVIKGQATVGLEILDQVGHVDSIFVPVGGGGLLSGISQFFAKTNVVPDFIGVEALNFGTLSKAMERKDYNDVHKKNSTSIAEGIAVKGVGDLCKEICLKTKPKFVTVTDQEIESAITLLLEKQKLVVEGAGAATCAAALKNENVSYVKKKSVVLIVSGGNIDITLLRRLVSKELIKTRRLSKISIIIKDIPGSLMQLLHVINKIRVNVIHIEHERLFAKLDWNEVMVNLTVETKDANHEWSLIEQLKDEGYEIKMTGMEN